jgi:hypothetical protein
MGSFSRKYRAISYNRRFAYPNKWIGNVAQDNTIEDVKKITTIPTLIVKGELSPKFLLRIVDILSDNMPNTEQILIPNVSQGLGLMSRQQHL